MIRRVRTLVILLAAALALSSCRVDVTVDVTIGENGTGTVTVTLAADREVVEQAPGLVDDLRFSDVQRVGWTIDGPTIGEEGTLSVVLSHPFASPEEATALIASLNGPQGPFKSVLFTRFKTPKQITFTVSGAGRVDGGMGAFADTDLMNLIASAPYTNDIANADLSLDQAVSVTFRVKLPGSIISTTGSQSDGDTSTRTTADTTAHTTADTTLDTTADSSDTRNDADMAQAITWTVPLDGRQVDLGTTSIVSLERGGAWPTVAAVVRIAFFGWVSFCVIFITAVLAGRRRRSHRKRRRTSAPNPTQSPHQAQSSDEFDAFDA